MTTGTQAPTTDLADFQVPDKGQESVNNIPTNAIQIFGTGGAVATLPLTQFLDTQNVLVFGRIKAVYIFVGAAVPTKGAASQATIQIYTGLQAFAQASGAASSLPHAGNAGDQSVYGTPATNLGANAATLALASSPYVFTPTDIPGLQWELPWVGVEINWGGALTSGAAAIFLVTSGL